MINLLLNDTPEPARKTVHRRKIYFQLKNPPQFTACNDLSAHITRPVPVAPSEPGPASPDGCRR